MLSERQISTSTSGGSSRSRLSAEKLKASLPRLSAIDPQPCQDEAAAHFSANIPPQKRRDQNRVSQRAFRLRKEKHAADLEAKVEQLGALLETASYENSVATSRMHSMEAELSYSRGMLFAAISAHNTRGPNSSVTSYPSSDYRPDACGDRFAAAGNGQVGVYNAISHYAAPYKPVIASLETAVLADEYQRAGSYESSSTDTYLPAVESPPQSFSTPSELGMSPQGRTLDGSLRASCLQFNTEEPVTVTEDCLH
jgi:hypothetical protein